MSQILPALIQLDHFAIGGFQSAAKGAKRWFKLYENAAGLEGMHMLRTEVCYGISFEEMEVQHMEKLEALEKDLELLMEINGPVKELVLVRKILEHAREPLGEAVKGVLVREGDSEILVGG